jgi:putative hemolysin
MTQVAFEIVALFLLFIANGMLAMAEMSLVSVRKARLKALARDGNKAAGRALELAETPNQFLSTVQIGITLVGVLAGAFGGATLARLLGNQFASLGLPEQYAQSTSLVLVVLCITYLFADHRGARPKAAGLVRARNDSPASLPDRCGDFRSLRNLR